MNGTSGKGEAAGLGGGEDRERGEGKVPLPPRTLKYQPSKNLEVLPS